MNKSYPSTRVWDLAAVILTLGTMGCAILAAITYENFINRPQDGGSITTRLPGVVYASVTVMKVCLVSGLVAVTAAVLRRVLRRRSVGLPSKEATGSLRSLTPTWTITSIAMTPLAQLVGALAVVIAQLLIDKPNGVSLSYFPQTARTGVFVMLAQISIAAIAGVISILRREGFGLLSVLGLITNTLLISLFVHFEFYALGFDQDLWAPPY